jgi:hypothetical protein
MLRNRQLTEILYYSVFLVAGTRELLSGLRVMRQENRVMGSAGPGTENFCDGEGTSRYEYKEITYAYRRTCQESLAICIDLEIKLKAGVPENIR